MPHIVKAYCHHINPYYFIKDLVDFNRISGPWKTTLPPLTNPEPEVRYTGTVQ
jgi:hypothetical protein